MCISLFVCIFSSASATWSHLNSTVFHQIAVITPFNLAFSLMFHPCLGHNGRKTQCLFCVAQPCNLTRLDYSTSLWIAVGKIPKLCHHFRALIIFFRLFKEPWVILYCHNACIFGFPWVAGLLFVCNLTFVQSFWSLNPNCLYWSFTALSHPDIAAVIAGWWVRRGSHSRPSEAKRKWCHSCPDYYDSLVSDCALILPYI